MGDYEADQAKKREELDAQFRAASEPLAATIADEILKATGLKVKRSVHEGSYAISLRLDEPRVDVEISHDWGARHRHWSRLPSGKPKIGLSTGRYSYGGRTWYRPAKDGSFNIPKIVARIKEAADSAARQKQWDLEAKEKQEASAAAYTKDLAGIKLPEGSNVIRNHEQNNYSLKFAGTFENLSPLEVEAVSKALAALTKQFSFTKSWRTELF